MIDAADIEVIRAEDLSREAYDLWLRLHRSDETLRSPFFHPQFTLAVAAVRTDVRIAVIHRGGVAVGFFPFQTGRFGTGCAVGGRRSNYHGVIAEPDLEWEPISLARAAGLRIWDFAYVPVTQTPFAPFFARVAESYCVDISRGFAQLSNDQQHAGSRFVPRVGEKARRLEREVGPITLEPASGDPEVLECMMRWKSRQYQRTGQIDNFAYLWNVTLLKRLHATSADEFSGMLVALRAGGKLLAVDMGLRSGSAFHSWFPAYDQTFARYSPGLILFLKLLQQSDSLGLALIDLGRDSAEYKTRLATHTVSLGEGSVLVPSAAATARLLQRHAAQLVKRTPLMGPARRSIRRLRAVAEARGGTAR